MKITETLLRSIIRDLLQEEVYGAMAFVYTGSQAPPEVFIPLIVDDLLDPGKGKGALYGKGLYTVYDLPGTQTEKGFYGSYIYKLAINLYGYVCLDSDVAAKVYGKPLSVVEQLELLDVDEETIEAVKQILESKPITGSFTAPAAQPISVYLRGVVKGLVFTGSHDGRVAVVYDAATVTPVAYKTVKSKKWNSVDRDTLRQSVVRTQADWRKERYEENNVEKLRRLKAKFEMFKHLGRAPNPEDLVIVGDLDLSGGISASLPSEMASGITELPDGLQVTGTLRVDPNTTRLPQGLKVGGHLSLYDTQVSAIPDGLEVGGDLITSRNTDSIGSGVKIGGSFIASSASITALPDDMQVGKSIILDRAQIERLPDGLTVNGNLNLSRTPIRALPSGLSVSGTLDLVRSAVTKLPEDLQVGDGINLGGAFPLHGIPKHLLHAKRKDGTQKVTRMG